MQVATPSRERVGSYQALREEVEVEVGRINGLHGRLGHPAIHYLHQSFPRDELAALYLAADVMLVTALRDGMNLVAKEYVASRVDERGALVLSEFTGAANELTQAYLVNPHDIDGLKEAIIRAVHTPQRELTRRMRAMRRQVFRHDVSRLGAGVPDRPRRSPRRTSDRQPPVPDTLHAALVDLSAREEILVASDFDGVIAPIVERPEQARALPATMVALERLAALPGTPTSSWSPVALWRACVRWRTRRAGIALVGGHGSEVSLNALPRRPGLAAPRDPGRGNAQLLECTVGVTGGDRREHPGAHVERKTTSATVHTRAVARDAGRLGGACGAERPGEPGRRAV